jgi:hypothetical protein
MTYQLITGSSYVRRIADNATIPNDPNNSDWQAYLAWVADGHTATAAAVVSAPERAAADLATKIAAGLPLVSTGTSSLNATYAIDNDSATIISGIYAGIKGADGLPGGGGTFAYADITGTTHNFDEAHFAAFAKAVRDYRYALTQAARTEAAGGSPSWPTTPVTIA